MIRIDSDFSRYYNFIIHSFLTALYFEEGDYGDRLESAKDHFPNHLAREQPEKCLQVMDDLYYWTMDDYMHDLDNFHQLGLYKFLIDTKEYEIDTGHEEFSQTFYSSDQYKRIIDEVWQSTGFTEELGEKPSKHQLIKYLQDIDTIINTCFEDIDFITFPQILAHNRDDGSDPAVVSKLIDYYEDTLPKDIVASYRKRLEESLKPNSSLNQIVSGIMNTLSHKTEFDTLGIALNSCSEKGAHFILKPFFEAMLVNYPEINIAYEPTLAKAKPDFTFQMSGETIIAEVKLGKGNIRHGIEQQLTYYMDAMRANASYMLIICQTNEQLEKAHRQSSDAHRRPGLCINTVILNASSDKPAASKLPYGQKDFATN